MSLIGFSPGHHHKPVAEACGDGRATDRRKEYPAIFAPGAKLLDKASCSSGRRYSRNTSESCACIGWEAKLVNVKGAVCEASCDGVAMRWLR